MKNKSKWKKIRDVGTILEWVVREGLSEEVITDQRPE